jgi:MFS family permease
MDVSRSAPSRPNLAWTLALTSVAFFMVVLDGLVVINALPAIRRDLGVSLATLQWTVNAFTLAFAASTIPRGARRPVWAPESLRRRVGALRAGIGVLRPRAER